MLFAELKDIHNKTMYEFAEKFNASKVAPNLVFVVNVAETGMADAVIVDLDMKNANGENNYKNNILSVDWERRSSFESFKHLYYLTQQERKLKDWTDIAIQTNRDGKEIAVGFTEDWLHGEKAIESKNIVAKNKDGKPIRDANGDVIIKSSVDIDVRKSLDFAVWNTHDIDSFKLCIAEAINNGRCNKQAFYDHKRNGARQNGHVFIPSNTSNLAEKHEPDKNSICVNEGLKRFADRFNRIDGWNGAVANVVIYPLPYENKEYNAMIINMDNNTKVAVKFADDIDWNDGIQMDDIYLKNFKDVVADALGNGYEAPEGHYPDIDEIIKENDKNGVYGNPDARELDRIRRYSLRMSEPFHNQIIDLKQGFTVNIKDVETLYFKVRKNEQSLDDEIRDLSKLSGRPKRVWGTFSALSSRVKKKQKDIAKNVKKDTTYLQRQSEILKVRNKEELYHIPAFSKNTDER